MRGMQNAAGGTLKERALAFYANARGWRTKRRLIIFESDDWGAVRMPGPEVYNQLLSAGISVDKSSYARVDSLENGRDLELLMALLGRHQDFKGRSPIFTFNTVLGNPDFSAIRDDRFERFHHEHFFTSYLNVHGRDLESVWREGIDAGVIRPQFHAREHLNVPLWMRDLKAGHTAVRTAFDCGYYGLTTETSSTRQTNYLAAFWVETLDDLGVAQSALIDGLRLFEKTFGFRSASFVPCNYVLASELEDTAYVNGVRLIQGQRGQLAPDVHSGKFRVRRAFTGQRSSRGLVYSVRNVLFEPFSDDRIDWVARAMHDIASAFKLRKPAIVCSHRANYTSGMSTTNRDRSLHLLEELLTAIIKRWPNVEFTTSDELLQLMAPR